MGKAVVGGYSGGVTGSVCIRETQYRTDSGQRPAPNIIMISGRASRVPPHSPTPSDFSNSSGNVVKFEKGN